MARYLTCIGALVLSCALTIPASAQNFMPDRAARKSQPVITVSIATIKFIDESKDVSLQQAEALRTFYQSTKDSCAQVLATVADSCEVRQMSINVNMIAKGPEGRHLNVTGRITMNVKFKSGSK